MTLSIARTATSAGPSPSELMRITQAYDFVARAHVDQRRKGKGKEPYVNHLAEVAYLVARATGGTVSMIKFNDGKWPRFDQVG